MPVSMCVLVWGGYTHLLRKELIYHVRATGGVCVHACVCVTGGMYPAVLSPFWLFLLVSAASVCTLIKTLNLFLTHTLARTHTHPHTDCLPQGPRQRASLLSTHVFPYTHTCTLQPELFRTLCSSCVVSCMLWPQVV